MPGVSRVNIDTAGGLITGILAPTVFVNGFPIAVKGATIQSHGSPPHAAAVMVGSSTTVFANGIGVCRAGDLASCNHVVTGSPNVNAN